ncbi:hypothetical protein NPX13_g10470 [Xylaria arbuscula]|uniref:Uncharacterized protein n=1 Tax=Xylaria arbuscula TaxID=114810 RepID=A0A9W8N505_9PEZI|nr:hypothetical protein NPX13_g10470 [Xylaria arbuscula]
MEPLKRFMWGKKDVDKSKSKDQLQISLPIEGSFKKVTGVRLVTDWPSRKFLGSLYSGYPPSVSPTIAFTPQARGREETIAYLNTGSSGSLTSLLTEQDKASEQIKRGPHTQGTREVQQILEEPTHHSLQQLYDLQREAEMKVHYGTPGVVMYNFSKSFGWNQTKGTNLPPLQLRNLDKRRKGIRFAASTAPYLPPINSLVPQQPTPSASTSHQKEKNERQVPRCPTPVSEPGGWRDVDPPEDIADIRLQAYFETPLGGGETDHSDEVSDEEVDENSEGESAPVIGLALTSSERRATAIKVIPVTSSQIRQVSIH